MQMAWTCGFLIFKALPTTAWHAFCQPLHVTEAKSANIVILNHAYFVYHYQDLIDQAILTEKAKVIIDECHQLPVTVHQQHIKTLQSKEVEETLLNP